MTKNMCLLALLGLTACHQGNQTHPHFVEHAADSFGSPGSLHFEAYVADSLGAYEKKVDYLDSAVYPAKDTFFHDKTFTTGHWKIVVNRMTDSEMKVTNPWQVIQAEGKLRIKYHVDSALVKP